MTTRDYPPLPQQIEFVALHGRKVHVVAEDPDAWRDQPAAPRRFAEGPVDPMAWLLGHVRTRCGRDIARHIGGADASGALVSRFTDDRLCAACHATVSPDEQPRLFEHPTPDDDTDD